MSTEDVLYYMKKTGGGPNHQMLYSYQGLIVWQRSVQLLRAVYVLTKQLPREEQCVFTQQMRRAVLSVPSNIAEGYSRKGRREYLYFLSIARGSMYEFEGQVYICRQLYPNHDYHTVMELLNEVQRMLAALIRRLSTDDTLKP